MTQAFSLCPLTPPHAEDAATLVRRAFAAIAVAADPRPSALHETADGIRAILAIGGGMAAEATGALVGMVLWQEKDGGLYLSRLSVDPAWRGRGIARTLIAAAERECRQRRLPRLWLSTRLAFADNRRLFAACGFVETTQHAHPGYDWPTFVDMEKTV